MKSAVSYWPSETADTLPLQCRTLTADFRQLNLFTYEKHIHLNGWPSIFSRL